MTSLCLFCFGIGQPVNITHSLQGYFFGPRASAYFMWYILSGIRWRRLPYEAWWCMRLWFIYTSVVNICVCELYHHWFMSWRVASSYQAITWTYVDISLCNPVNIFQWNRNSDYFIRENVSAMSYAKFWLFHWRLVTSHGDIDLGQHWLR